MKKLIALTLLLALLCACGTTSKYPTDNEYHPETDYSYSMYTTSSFLDFLEANEGYYFWVPNTLLYMDHETMEPLPMCSKPNCLHYNETDRDKYRACNAFFTPLVTLPIAAHNGNLYVISRTVQQNAPLEVLRVASDGSNRETLMTFDPKESVQNMRVHRGIMYLVTASRSESGEGIGRIYAYNLDTPKKEPKVILEYPIYLNTTLSNLTIRGQYMYFTRYISEEFGNVEFCIYNINTAELITIPPDETGLVPNYVLFCDDSMFMIYRKGSDGSSDYVQQMYRCNYDGSNQEFVTDDVGYYASDGQYLYRTPMFFAYENTDHFLRIFDSDYNEVDYFDLNELPNMTSIKSASCHISSKHVLLETVDSGTDRDIYYYFDKSGIGSGNIQPKIFIDYKYFEDFNPGM